jgi:two-component system sensor histidine kinase KdpD
VAAALDSLPTEPGQVVVGDLDTVPDAVVDPALLERVVANLVGNAVRHGGSGRPVTLTASALGERVELRIIDRGQGIRPEDWERVFTPFQRLGDHDNTTGVGLGLALSRGLVEAMGGTLAPEETPGGGLTMVVSVPAAGTAPAGDPHSPDEAVDGSVGQT